MSWLAGFFGAIASYVLKDVIMTFVNFILKKWNEYLETQRQKNRQKDLLDKLKNAKTEEEKTKIEEDILNGN